MNHLAQRRTFKNGSDIPQVTAYPKNMQEPQRTVITECSFSDSANVVLDKLTRHFDELTNSLKLPNDWDGDDGHAPAKQDVWNALTFLVRIPSLGIISAEVMVIGDGEVNFDWDKSGICLEVGFSDGEISFYGETPDGKEFTGTEAFIKGTVPAQLQHLINTNFSG